MPLTIVDTLHSFEQTITFLTSSLLEKVELEDNGKLFVSRYAFRGVANKVYELIPSVGRQPIRERAMFLYDLWGDKHSFSNLLANAGDIIKIEVDNWEDLSESQRLEELNNYWGSLEYEKKIDYVMWYIEINLLYAYKNYAYSYLQKMLVGDISDPWFLTTIAQHYGIPTRFLDWSYSPLIALYFAVKDDYDNDAAIYCLNSREYKFIVGERTNNIEPPYSLGEIFFYEPRIFDKRVENQDSVFTGCGFPYKKLSDENLDKASMESYKIIIPKSLKKTYLLKLQMLGVRHDKMFPDLEGVAKRVKYEMLGE